MTRILLVIAVLFLGCASDARAGVRSRKVTPLAAPTASVTVSAASPAPSPAPSAAPRRPPAPSPAARAARKPTPRGPAPAPLPSARPPGDETTISVESPDVPAVKTIDVTGPPNNAIPFPDPDE